MIIDLLLRNLLAQYQSDTKCHVSLFRNRLEYCTIFFAQSQAVIHRYSYDRHIYQAESYDNKCHVSIFRNQLHYCTMYSLYI